MTQISRPFQIALLALVLARGRLVLRASAGTHTSTGSFGRPRRRSSSAAPLRAPRLGRLRHRRQPPLRATSTTGPPRAWKASRAIAKAHGAVGDLEAERQAARRKIRPGASTTPAGNRLLDRQAHLAARRPALRTTATASSATPRDARPRASAPRSGAPPGTPRPRRIRPASREQRRRTQPSASARRSASSRSKPSLKQGKVACVLFWNPAASVDGAVQAHVQLGRRRPLGGKIAVTTRAPSRSARSARSRAPCRSTDADDPDHQQRAARRPADRSAGRLRDRAGDRRSPHAR